MGCAGRNERIIMAGHSAGGQVAEQYALQKTGGLILLVCCSSGLSQASYSSDSADGLSLYCVPPYLRLSVTEIWNV